MPNPRSRHKPAHDAPEITTSPATAGRETLVAIAEEEAVQARTMMERKGRSAPPPSGPNAAIPPAARPNPPPPAARTARAPSVPPARSTPSRSTPPPRTTRGVGAPFDAPATRPPAPPSVPPAGRARFETVDYHDRPLPGVAREGSAPDLIEIGTRPMGRETLAAITGELANELLEVLSREERSTWLPQLEEAIVLEPFRFEVRGAPMLARPNDALRREFVSRRLLHRLPVSTIDEVSRIDAATTADDTVTLTLWVKIPER